jgi:hypothetical protein
LAELWYKESRDTVDCEEEQDKKEGERSDDTDSRGSNVDHEMPDIIVVADNYSDSIETVD